MMKRNVDNILYSLTFVVAILLGESAFATCTTPTSQVVNAGTVEYFTSSSNYKICTGTVWEVIDLATPNGSTCSVNKARDFDFSAHVPVYCDGSNFYETTCNTTSYTSGYCAPTDEDKLYISGIQTGSKFGTSIAISGDTNSFAVENSWLLTTKIAGPNERVIYSEHAPALNNL